MKSIQESVPFRQKELCLKHGRVKIGDEAVLFVTFLIFFFSLCPTIYVGDSSLFAAASFSFGSAHPPGYPLFVILGKLFTFIPFGNIAFRVNLVSAVSGALTCLMVFKTSMELTENRHASWAAALICGISPIFYTESIKAEAYSLNSFIAMCVFYLGARILRGRDVFRNSLLAFFLIGLGMGNHHTIGFMGLIILVPIAVRWRDVSVKLAFFSAFFLLAGMSVYFFLYVRSVAIADSGGLILYSVAGTLKDFLHVFFRQDYKGASTPHALERTFSFGMSWYYGLRNSLYNVAFGSLKPVLPFLLLGLIGLIKRLKLLAYFAFSVVVWFLLLGKLVFPGSNPGIQDIEVGSVYFLPSIPILYSLVSVGFAEAISLVKKKHLTLLAGVLPYGIAILPFVFLPYTVRQYALDRNTICYDYGRDMLLSLPVKSLLMNHSDNSMFTVFYMKAVERLRDDTLAMDTAGKEDVFGLEAAPPWKYSGLYPAFYGKRKSTISQINEEFALRGKLFVSNPLDMTETVSRSYYYYPYLFTAALWPKALPAEGFESDVRRRFKATYEKTNYLEVAGTSPSEDFLVQELLKIYSMNTLLYADFIDRDGDKVKGNEYLRLAFEMSPLEKVLWPYLNFLLRDGRKDRAFYILAELREVEGYGEMADFLEQKALSVTNGTTEGL
jgi:hypothetical protein